MSHSPWMRPALLAPSAIDSDLPSLPHLIPHRFSHRLVPMILGAIGFLGGLVLSHPSFAQAPLGGSIRGAVHDEAGAAIAGARVIASYGREVTPPPPSPPEGEAETLTGTDGRYEIDLPHPGCFLVRVEAAGFITEFYDNAAEPWGATCVEVAEGAAVDGIDFILALGGAITGTITDARSGAPLAQAVVSAWPSFPDSTMGGGMAVTDDTGAYRIDGLGRGSYLVQASAEGHIAEFYDDTQDPANATPVTVEPPATTPGIDFVLGRGGCIRGRVVTRDGLVPIAGAYVWLGGIGQPIPPPGPLPPHGPLPPSPPPPGDPSGGPGIPPDPGGGAVTGPDGTYEICGLPAGEYTVMATAAGYLTQWYHDVDCWDQARPVRVPADGDVAGIGFALDRAGRIEGHVLAGGSPIAGAWVQAWTWTRAGGDSTFPEPPPQGPCADGSGFAQTDSSGAYIIDGLAAGAYVVLAEGPEFLQTFFGGGQDPDHATRVTVQPPQSTPGIDIALERGGAITGHVRDAVTGAPLSGVWVDVYLPGIPRGGQSGGMQRSQSETGPDGAYRIAGLPSGNYIVFATAFEQGYEAEFYPDARSPEDAVPVPVTAPEETGNIDFALDASHPMDGAIGGQVVAAEDQTPFSGAVVVAVSLAGYSGFAVADSSGFYWIPGLAAGDYVVLAAANGRLGEFYDDAHSWEEATPVEVRGSVSGIDFALAALGFGPGSISGRVTDDRGTPVMQAWVYAEPLDTGDPAGFATSGADGRYTIGGLAPGRYRVQASRLGMPTGYALEGSSIEVGEAMVPGIDIALRGAASPGVMLGTEPNAPNPFRDATAIRLRVEGSGVAIAVDLFDVNGRRVRRLGARAERSGVIEIPWDGLDSNGRPATSGIYLYRASAGDQVTQGRLALVR